MYIHQVYSIQHDNAVSLSECIHVPGSVGYPDILVHVAYVKHVLVLYVCAHYCILYTLYISVVYCIYL